MDEQQYLAERLDAQIKWYCDESEYNKKWFYRIRIIEIVLASIMPLLTSYISIAWYMKGIINVCAILIAVLGGVASISKFQERWIEYRTTGEALKQEKFLYLTKSGFYNANNHFCLLVERVETIFSKENSNWAQMVRNKDNSQERRGDNGQEKSVR